MSRSISTSHLQNLIRTRLYLDTEFPNFDYRREYLHKDPDGNSMLHNACLNQRFVIVKYLLQNGFSNDINSKNKAGQTPLHLVVMNICINQRFLKDLFDLLIEYGANIIEKDYHSNTAVDIISKFNVQFAGTDYIIALYQNAKTQESRTNFLYCVNKSTQNNEYIKQLNFYEKLGIMKFM